MEVNLFFSISISPSVKTFLPIFTCDQKFLCFMMFRFFWSNWYFALGLWPHFC